MGFVTKSESDKVIEQLEEIAENANLDEEGWDDVDDASDYLFEKLALKPHTLLQVMFSGLLNIRRGAEKLPKDMKGRARMIQHANALYKLIKLARGTL